MPRIAVCAHAVLDRIHRPGAAVREAIGGAGAYAAAGASLAARGQTRPVLVSGTGASHLTALTDWCAERLIEASGLFVSGEHGPITEVRYRADGERTEEPVFGLAHFEALTPLPQQLPDDPDSYAGVYLFHNADPSYWRKIAEFRSRYSGQIAWEIAADACTPEQFPLLRRHAELADIVIINRRELATMAGSESVAAVDEAAGALGRIVLVHDGTRGSVVHAAGRRWQCAIRPVEAVDVTGGGNSLAGAFVQAYVDSGDPVSAARLAASAAAEVVSVPGAPTVDQQRRELVRQAADNVAVTELEG